MNPPSPESPLRRPTRGGTPAHAARALAALALSSLLGNAARAGEPPATGSWRAWLATHGGELPFALELTRDGAAWQAAIGNGLEQIAVPATTLAAATLTLDFPHYDSQIVATVAADGRRLDGTWRKRRSADEWLELPFHATAGSAKRFTAELLHAPPPGADGAQLAREFATAVAAATGRFAVKFASSEDAAVGEFTVAADGSATGTFLTTTGDCRYLAGQLDRGFAGDDGLVGCEDDGLPHHFLRLSCFDGAHAFLFSAEIGGNDSLAGGFWSGDRWYEAWTARRDPQAALPDGFAQSAATGAVTLGELAFPQVFPELPAAGAIRRLDDPAFAGKARLLQVFGSWCPNCQEACEELLALEREFGPRGLVIQGLAFEVTGDLARDGEQVRRYAQRHGVRWPLLLAGTADKQAATASLGLLDRVRAYPTTLFLDAKGTIHHVFTGFSGKATGATHVQQHAEFVRVIEELLRAE